MAVRERGSKFQVDFMHKGTRYRPEFESRTEAEAWELTARAALILGKPVEEPKKLTPGAGPATIMGLVRYVAENHWKGKKSAETLIRNAELFAEYAGPECSIGGALTTEKVQSYCRDLEARGRSSATVNRHLSAISTVTRFAVKLRRLDANMTPELSWQKEGQGRLRFFTQAEAKTLLQFLRQIGRSDDAEFYEFLLDSGARLSEATKLLWRDVAPDRVTFVDTKNGRNRTIVLPKRSRETLARLRQGVRAADRGPFSTINKHSQIAVWRRLQTQLPFLGDAVPHHTFRHTYCSWLVQAGIDLYRVKEAAGHSSITTTERYAHLAPAHMEALASVLEAAE